MSECWRYTGEHTLAATTKYVWGVEIQECGDKQMLFAHLTVYRWSKSVFRELLGVFAKFRESFPNVPLYCVGLPDDNKFERFVAHFGFKPIIDDVIRENGAHSRLYLQKEEERNLNGRPDLQFPRHSIEHSASDHGQRFQLSANQPVGGASAVPAAGF